MTDTSYNTSVEVERDALASAYSTSGGTTGEQETDVSSGHSVCSREECGSSPPSGSLQAQSKPRTIREMEAALRTLGFSKREANTIATRGFKALAAPSDDLSELAALLRRTTEAIERNL